MTHELGARYSIAGSLGPLRVKTSVAMPRSLKAAHTWRTYTFRPPFSLRPRDAVGEVCMEMTAIRAGPRAGRERARSATVRRSRVKPASRDAAEAGTRDRRTGRHNWLNLRASGVFLPPAAGGPARTRLDMIGLDAPLWVGCDRGYCAPGLRRPHRRRDDGLRRAHTCTGRLGRGERRHHASRRPAARRHPVRAELHGVPRG